MAGAAAALTPMKVRLEKPDRLRISTSISRN
jgi:hypothetical protein